MPVVSRSKVRAQFILQSRKLGDVKVKVTATQPQCCVFGEQHARKSRLLDFIREPDKREIIFNHKQTRFYGFTVHSSIISWMLFELDSPWHCLSSHDYCVCLSDSV